MTLQEHTNALLSAERELSAYWAALLPDLPVPSHFQWMVWLVRHKFAPGLIKQGIDSVLTLISKKPDIDAEQAVKYASGAMHKIARKKV
jgi:hypothetical protein